MYGEPCSALPPTVIVMEFVFVDTYVGRTLCAPRVPFDEPPSSRGIVIVIVVCAVGPVPPPVPWLPPPGATDALPPPPHAHNANVTTPARALQVELTGYLQFIATTSSKRNDAAR